ncbi:MAG: radical SAM protein [Nitrospinota bacterium]
MGFVPYAISWNLTKRCNLACKHCYLDAGAREKGADDELSEQQALEVVSQIAEVNPGTVLILTGGEPLMHPAIYKICKKAHQLGMMPVLGTNGTMLTSQVVEKLKDAGVSGIGVSIDSMEEDRHDTFRGTPGALIKSIEGLTAARDGGLEIQVQTTPTSDNVREIPQIAEWAHHFGASVFNLFFLVCTGRGETMADISPQAYEDILKWAADSKDTFPGMMIRPKCAPHFKRILHQQDPNHPLLQTYIAACRAGTHYCRITPDGKVTPCPYMPTEAGDLKESRFDSIWNNSPALQQYRSPEYGGKCGLCRYRLMCGGCRARAYATLGDEMAEDQWCVYEPLALEEPIQNIDTLSKFDAEESADSLSDKWSDVAREKLLKIPFFARSIVQRAVEKYAEENSIDEITPEIMRAAAPPPGRFAPNVTKKNSGNGNEVEWDEKARERVKDAPHFVQKGILKLMQKRAKERSQDRISDAFLTEIRNESMMLVTRRIKKLGFEKLNMDAWDKAKEKFKKSEVKQKTIEEIVGHLDGRDKPNKTIIEKFASYFEDDSKKMGWTKEARERIEKAPAFVREMAKAGVEKYAKENGYKYVTEDALNEAMEKSPFGKFSKSQ